MIVGAFVLPPTIVGMIEASITRRPCRPWTRSLRVDDGLLVGVAHPRGAHGVVDQHQAPAQVGLELARDRPSPGPA